MNAGFLNHQQYHSLKLTAVSPLKMEGWKMNILKLVGGFIFLLFSQLPGEMIRFDEHIFQMGASTTNELLYVSIKESRNMQMSSK